MGVSYVVSVAKCLENHAACVHLHEVWNQRGTSVLVSMVATVNNYMISSLSVLSLSSKNWESKYLIGFRVII